MHVPVCLSIFVSVRVSVYVQNSSVVQSLHKEHISNTQGKVTRSYWYGWK